RRNLDVAEADRRELTVKLESAETILTTERVQGDSLRTEIETIRAAEKQREQEITAIRAAVETDDQDYGAKLIELRRNLDVAEADRRKLTAKLESAETILTTERAQGDTLRTEIEAIRAAGKQREQEMARISRELDGARKFLRDSQS